MQQSLGLCLERFFSSRCCWCVWQPTSSYSANSPSLLRQVAVILKSKEKSFVIRHVEVQRQSGTKDCGLFAVAFAVSLCMRHDPHMQSYDQSQMRTHLKNCISKNLMTSFPPASKPRRLGRVKFLKEQRISVFCVCRLPWDRRNKTKGALVFCTVCKDWFHQVCCSIPQSFLDDQQQEYTCMQLWLLIMIAACIANTHISSQP